MLTVGATLKGRYRIDAVVGEGGMARVYKAWDRVRNYCVAVKALHQDFAEDREVDLYFQREAQLLAKLAHRNIVRFYSYERDGATAFIVMDYVEGATLRARIFEAAGPMALAEALAVLEQCCAALHYAHEEGVVHRDIKPANIMLQKDGRVLLSDFGIGKAIGASSITLLAPGTPAYMAPEQWLGETVDRPVDIYSLGIVAFEMLTGRRPFTGVNPAAPAGSTETRVRWEHLCMAPPAPSDINPRIPKDLSFAVMKALAKDPADRYASIAEFWEALAAATGLESRSWTIAAGPAGVATAETAATAERPYRPDMPPVAAGAPAPSAATKLLAPARPGHSKWLAAAGVAVAVLLLLAAFLASGTARDVLSGRSGGPNGPTLTSAAAVHFARTKTAVAVAALRICHVDTEAGTHTHPHARAQAHPDPDRDMDAHGDANSHSDGYPDRHAHDDRNATADCASNRSETSRALTGESR